jgi:FkbM family methyltransferase
MSEKPGYLNMLEFFAGNKWRSVSQISQDLLVLYFTEFKKKGFFVEIGAADGFYLSNTLILENFGWEGIIAEPLPRWHEKIKKRTCQVDLRCIYDKSNSKLIFEEVQDYPELSGSTEDLDEDNNSSLRKNTRKFEVDTISLDDLLEEYNAPNKIDYISVDTEGSEYKILKNFNFKKYDIEIFTVEHNFIQNKRDNVFELMLSNNYIRVFQKISQWDDWYVKKDNIILKQFTSEDLI